MVFDNVSDDVEMIRTSVDNLDAAAPIVDQITAMRPVVSPVTAASSLHVGRPLMRSAPPKARKPPVSNPSGPQTPTPPHTPPSFTPPAPPAPNPTPPRPRPREFTTNPGKQAQPPAARGRRGWSLMGLSPPGPRVRGRGRRAAYVPDAMTSSCRLRGIGAYFSNSITLEARPCDRPRRVVV